MEFASYSCTRVRCYVTSEGNISLLIFALQILLINFIFYPQQAVKNEFETSCFRSLRICYLMPASWRFPRFQSHYSQTTTISNLLRWLQSSIRCFVYSASGTFANGKTKRPPFSAVPLTEEISELRMRQSRHHQAAGTYPYLIHVKASCTVCVWCSRPNRTP